MSYQTQREKIKDHIEKIIIPSIKLKELDYYKLVSSIASELGSSDTMVEDVMRSFVNSGKLDLVLMLSYDEALKVKQEHDKQTQEDIKKAGLI